MAGSGPGEVLAGGRKLVGISNAGRVRGAGLVRRAPVAAPRLCAELLTGPAAGASLDVDALAGTITTLAQPRRSVQAMTLSWLGSSPL
ncbi:MAG: hypothetical protein R2699_13790 [Acidimicrobiales bacterium]